MTQGSKSTKKKKKKTSNKEAKEFGAKKMSKAKKAKEQDKEILSLKGNLQTTMLQIEKMRQTEAEQALQIEEKI